MSRTKHHGYKQKQKTFGRFWRWYQSEPKIWRKFHKHKPQRAARRQASTKLKQFQDLEDFDDTQWPLDRKPWKYYW